MIDTHLYFSIFLGMGGGKGEIALIVGIEQNKKKNKKTPQLARFSSLTIQSIASWKPASLHPLFPRDDQLFLSHKRDWLWLQQPGQQPRAFPVLAGVFPQPVQRLWLQRHLLFQVTGDICQT